MADQGVLSTNSILINARLGGRTNEIDLARISWSAAWQTLVKQHVDSMVNELICDGLFQSPCYRLFQLPLFGRSDVVKFSPILDANDVELFAREVPSWATWILNRILHPWFYDRNPFAAGWAGRGHRIHMTRACLKPRTLSVLDMCSNRHADTPNDFATTKWISMRVVVQLVAWHEEANHTKPHRHMEHTKTHSYP